MRMKQQGEYTSYKYASELRKVYEEIDPEEMKDVEGYWSHLIEDYEYAVFRADSRDLISIHSEKKIFIQVNAWVGSIFWYLSI